MRNIARVAELRHICSDYSVKFGDIYETIENCSDAVDALGQFLCSYVSLDFAFTFEYSYNVGHLTVYVFDVTVPD